MHFTGHNSFAQNDDINLNLVWEEKTLTNKEGLRKLAFDLTECNQVQKLKKRI